MPPKEENKLLTLKSITSTLVSLLLRIVKSLAIEERIFSGTIIEIYEGSLGKSKLTIRP